MEILDFSCATSQVHVFSGITLLFRSCAKRPLADIPLGVTRFGSSPSSKPLTTGNVCGKRHMRQKGRQLQNGLMAVLRGLKDVSVGTRKSATRKATRPQFPGDGIVPSAISVQWHFSAEPLENGAKPRAFRKTTSNICHLAAFCQDILFARRLFGGNEAILGGNSTADRGLPRAFV